MRSHLLTGCLTLLTMAACSSTSSNSPGGDGGDGGSTNPCGTVPTQGRCLSTSSFERCLVTTENGASKKVVVDCQAGTECWRDVLCPGGNLPQRRCGVQGPAIPAILRFGLRCLLTDLEHPARAPRPKPRLAEMAGLDLDVVSSPLCRP
jgi:hypothetical protein